MTLGWSRPERTRHVLSPRSPKLVHVSSSPHHLRYPQINVEQAQNASAIRFAVSFDLESQLVQNVLAAVSSAS